MAALGDIIAYLYHEYPLKTDLSKARVNKLIYLADWISVLNRGHQVSDIQWVFNRYGPYVDDIIEAVVCDDKLHVQSTRNYFGDLKEIISADEDYIPETLSDEDKDYLSDVIKETSAMSFKPFIDFVYSTYPVKSQPRGASLNLPQLADQLKSLISRAASSVV
ncbi:MAG: Panacea domain-containing protein [Rickettsiales bacterium]|nr:Panacea domain-containing protein [Rickettsiales bacterium]